MGIFNQLFGGSSSADLKSLIKQGAFLVDVRSPGEFAAGHAKGAVNIPVDQVALQLDKFKDKNNIIVCCMSGGRSGQAKAILESNGITNVINGGSWNNVAQYC